MPPLKEIIRTDNWFSQKLPPLLAVAYALLLVGQVDPTTALRGVPFIILCLCSVAAYGHVVNDILDIQADAFGAKRNVMVEVSPGGRRLIVVALLVLGAAGLLALPWSPVGMGLLALNYLLPTIYSAPPFRLKEQGLAGVVSDTLGSHVVPTLFTAVAVLGPATWEQPIARGLVLSAVGWATCLGLRGILVHQVVDQKGDRAANVQTFASLRSPEATRSFVLKVILPLEAGCLIVFLALLPPFSKVLIAVVLVYLAGDASSVARRISTPMVYPQQPGLERHVPLLKNDFYEVWLPCALAVQLALDQLGYLWLVGGHFLLFHQVIYEVARLMTLFVRRQFQRVWSSSYKMSPH